MKEDLIRGDRTIGEQDKHINALSRSARDPDFKSLSLEYALILSERAPGEYREENIFQTSDIARQHGIIRAMFGSISERMTGSVRRLGAVIGRILHGRAKTETPASVQRLASGISRKDRFSSHASIVEEAFRQMRKRTGVDAWEGYVHRAPDIVDANKLDVKAIAFYVSEFYSVRGEFGRINDGATPWTNISEALPRYLDHYQPHLPGELGFYDQRLPDVLRDQVALARQYGVYGFCFHHYWHEGRHIPGRPLDQFLSDPSLNIRFCICWMNEDRRSSKGAAVDNALDSAAGETALIEYLESAFSDPRYIRIDGKPLLIVHRPAILSDALAVGRRWRARAKELGFPDLYLVASRADESAEPQPIEFDASVEYPPHETAGTEITSECSVIDTDFSGHIFSYLEVLENHSNRPEPPFVNFKAVMTSWDDESRSPGAGTSFAGSTPALYARWLDRCCRMTMSRRSEERLVFINGWNNWANGAHLEPDRKFGYAYLQVTANILRQYQNVAFTEKLVESTNATFVPRSQSAIIFHCHYDDLIEPFLERYLAGMAGADLFVTVHPDIRSEAIEQIRSRTSNVYFLNLENRGRDIRPFMLALRQIRSLGYATACKIHTKKTPQAIPGFGEAWRQRLIDSLLGSEKVVSSALERFSTEPRLGILVPENSITDLSLSEKHVPNTFWLDRLLKRMNRSDLIGKYAFGFPAGSMFWFRVEALSGFDDLILAGDAFEQELGQRDGTLAHAAERLVILYAQERGFYTKEISDYSQK